MMWGVVSVGVDDRITAGMLSKQMKRPVVACVQFLREMGRRGMLKCVYSEEGRPESSQYLVTPTLYLQADPIDKPAVYGCVPSPVKRGPFRLVVSRTRWSHHLPLAIQSGTASSSAASSSSLLAACAPWQNLKNLFDSMMLSGSPMAASSMSSVVRRLD